MELDPDTIFERLRKKREEYRVENPPDSDLFEVDITGGKWTAAHFHVPWDCYIGKATGDEHDWPWTFCKKHGLFRQFGNKILRYTETHAAMLARVWCIKMAWMATTERDGGPAFKWTPAVMDGFQWPPDVVRWIAEIQTDPIVKSRFQNVQRLNPKM